MSDMSMAEYARYKDVSRTAVSKWVSSGRIKLNERGRINVADADFALGKTRQRVDTPPVDPEPNVPAGRRGNEAPGLTQARTVGAVYDARIKQLEYEEKVGRVVPTSGVADAATSCAEVLVRLFESLPINADDLTAAAAREGAAGVRRALRMIANKMRDEASKAFTRLAAEAAAQTARAAQAAEAENEAA